MFEVKVPVLGESITSATVANINKSVGDFVAEDEIILELETEKVNLEITANSAGLLSELLVKQGDDVKVEDLVAKIDESKQAKVKQVVKEPVVEIKKVKEPNGVGEMIEHHIFNLDLETLSPAVRSLVIEHNVDLSKVKMSGKNGRVLKSDILEYLENINNAQIVNKAPVRNKDALDRKVRKEKLPAIRKTIAKRLKDSQNVAAMLSTFNEVDMSQIMKIKKSIKQEFADKHGVNLGFMSFFTKAVCVALQENSKVNAYFLADTEEVEYHDYCDISIAVSSDKGLFVPVIRNAESLSFDQIEKTIKEFANKAEKGSLRPEDLVGGTFSITNGGIFGSMLSTPIINQPQSAILGMHNIVERPVVVDGQIVIRPIMYVALSYDHRLIDGSDAVSFLVRVKNLLENPEKLFFDL
ncbi:MAG TPA: dihydrolipoamide succinyltransferase [Alphaproteobacteria bacterium]|nr:dihydrolipoamide succinyltransferase [Alphaproteobacteria bacterium]